MINQEIFREYDIRGIIDKDLNEQSVKLIGYFLGLEICKKTSKIGKKPKVVVGFDARIHSPLLFEYLCSGLNASSCEVLGMGLVATGVNYFASFMEFDGQKSQASVMITGSHNTKEYNGFKITIDNLPFFGEDIYTLGKEIKKKYSKEIQDDKSYKKINVKTPYIAYMLNEFSFLKNMKNKFVIDCGNGVADTVLSQILDGLKLDYKGLFCNPDGTFPNHHPDPSEEENLQDLKAELKGVYGFGFAFDGDADRIAFLTKEYNVKGDILALLFAKTMKNPVIIGEVKCTQIMYDLINENGKAIMYKTGHSNLKVKLKEENADLAAEVSGHIFFNDRYFGFDDAIYACLRILELIYNGMDIDKEIKSLPTVYSSEELKIKTSDEEKFLLIETIKKLLEKPIKDFPKIKDIIVVDGLRIVFEDGWGLVRASNTSPVLVTRFEAKSKELSELYKQKINELILDAKSCNSSK